MKSIIDGFRYDTEKADMVGETNNIGDGASSVTDFSYWEAALYKTPRSGRFFLAGNGGPMTRFGKSVDQNTMTWGERIIPLEAQEALSWAEQYLEADDVERVFGDIIQDA